jgi:carboxy-terminal domain RNA polymerase II polypeptide A small phosphatase
MNRHLVIFDLDETLVHATKTALAIPHALEVVPYFVYSRPFCAELLEFCAEKFDIAVWSSSSDEYVQAVSSTLISNRYPLKFAWSANKCVQREDPHSNSYVYIKDLRKVQSQGYPVERITMIDDSPEKLKRQPRNLLQVKPFQGETNDDELLRVLEILRTQHG